jgi:DNA repair exonuclease SbcCD ATPase subunit
MGAPALNGLIEELTGVKYVDRLIELAVKKADVADRRLDALGEDLRDPGELEMILDDSKLALETAELKIEKLEPEIEQLKAAMARARRELNEAHDHNNKADETNLTIRELQTRVETLRSSYEVLKGDFEKMEVPDTSDLSEVLQGAVTELERMEAEIEAYEAEHHESDKHTEWLDENESRLVNQSENLETHKELSTDLTKAEKEMKAALEKYSTAQNALADAQNSETKAVCKTCQRPFDQKHLDEVRKKIPNLIKTAEETQADYAKAEAKVSDLRTKLAQLSRKLPPENWKEQIGIHKTLAAASKNRLEKLPQPTHEEITAAKQKVETLKQKKRMQAVNIRLHTEAGQRAERAKSAMDKAKKELDSVEAITKVAVDALIERHSAAVMVLSERSAERTAAAGEVSRLKAGIDELSISVRKARQLWQDRIDAETTKARYSKFARWLRENKAAFLNDTWAGLLALVSEFCSEVTSGVLEEVGRDPDGDFWFREEGVVRPILAASGGQKSIVGVGLRLALPSLLPASLGFIGLDEASADLNEEHAAALAGALRASERQVILVTHREGEEFSSDAVVVLE